MRKRIQAATAASVGACTADWNMFFAHLLPLSDKLRRSHGIFRNMKNLLKKSRVVWKTAMMCAVAGYGSFGFAETNGIPNPLIDYDHFLVHAADVGRLRDQRRVTEEKFIEMSAEPGTIIFDARSDDKYAKLHVKGAKHLSFPEITAEELAKIFPNKSTRILIYCNNNFLNAPNTFASKVQTASLNIHTLNTLYNYGYTNFYELGPLIDIRKAKLRFEGTQLEAP